MKLTTNYKRQDSLKSHRVRKRSWSVSVNCEVGLRPKTQVEGPNSSSVKSRRTSVYSRRLSRILDHVKRSGGSEESPQLPFAASPDIVSNGSCKTDKKNTSKLCGNFSKTSCYGDSSTDTQGDESINKDPLVLSPSPLA